jgi:hypothetical protein
MSDIEIYRQLSTETVDSVDTYRPNKYVSSERRVPHETNIGDSRLGFLCGRHRLRARAERG